MHRSQNGRVAGYVLIQAQPGNQVSELAELVARIPGVVKAERVHGAYDLIAEVPREHPGAPQAAEAIRRLDGVLRATSLATKTGLAATAGSDGEAA